MRSPRSLVEAELQLILLREDNTASRENLAEAEAVGREGLVKWKIPEPCYSKFCLTLLIWKTINAVTVILTVMKINPKVINAVSVMPVETHQAMS